MSSHFSLRAVPSASRQRTRTPVPRVSELVIREGPTPKDFPRRDFVDVPVIVTATKITNVAGDIWPELDNPSLASLPLYQIQISQDEKARPNVLYNFKAAFEAFLSHGKSADETALPSLQELERLGIRLVNTKPDDPDRVGVVPWRKVFYVVGDPETKPVSNMLLLLDGFWKTKEIEHQRKFDVQLHPHLSADVADVWDDLEFSGYSLEDPADDLPLKFWEGGPVSGKRIVSMYLQTSEGGLIDVLFGGYTYAFKARFDALGVKGGMANGAYYRRLEGLASDDPEQMQLLKKILGDGIFKDLAIRVVTEGDVPEDSPLSAFVQQLRKRSSCHFAR